MKYAILLITVLGACTSDTGATCPPTNAPTYQSFGQRFFSSYCTGCHSATATNRHGAPRNQNYDSEADIIKHLSDIEGEAAKGPNATNTDMPDLSGPVKMEPTDDERAQLGQYLACIAP